MIKNLRECSASRGTGKITLSRLANDKSLYIKVEDRFKGLRGAANDFGEKIPVQIFGSFIFRGL